MLAEESLLSRFCRASRAVRKSSTRRDLARMAFDQSAIEPTEFPTSCQPTPRNMESRAGLGRYRPLLTCYERANLLERRREHIQQGDERIESDGDGSDVYERGCRGWAGGGRTGAATRPEGILPRGKAVWPTYGG